MQLDNPLLEHLGVRLLDWEPGACRLALPVAPRHLNRQASLQGGVTATLLDAACGYAGLQAHGAHAVTLSLSINYLARAAAGEVRATGRVTGGGRRVYFASAELHDDAGRLLATAQGAFKRQ